MERETLKRPKLVNPENFNVTLPEQKVKIDVKWNLNKILLILFGIFLVFFLYNCKYGIFKDIQTEPVPYSLVYNLKN